MFRGLLLVLTILAPAFLTSCEREPAPAAATPESSDSYPIPEAAEWSPEQAVALLSDPDAAVSAAVRLLRLEEVSVSWLPSSGGVRFGALRVLALSTDCFAIGKARSAEPGLTEPWLIIAGQVAAPLLEEDLRVARLHVSANPKAFPHLLIAPGRVSRVEPDGRLLPALMLSGEPPAWFELRRRNRFPYVALLTWGGGVAAVIAEYRWDPLEQAFFGPARARSAWPPQGWIELDLEASEALEPQGTQDDGKPEQKPPQAPYLPDKPFGRDPV